MLLDLQMDIQIEKVVTMGEHQTLVSKIRKFTSEKRFFTNISVSA